MNVLCFEYYCASVSSILALEYIKEPYEVSSEGDILLGQYYI